MGLSRSIDIKTNKLNVLLRKKLVTYSEKKNIQLKRSLISKIKLTDVQEKEIKSFYKNNYGKEIPTDWHRLYQSYTGKYCVDYFPEIIFSTELEPYTNPYRIAEFLGNKNLLHPFFGDITALHVPYTYLSCANGVYRNEKHHIIGKNEAIRILAGLQSFVVKKTCDTDSGRDVCIFHNGADPNSILDDFGEEFVVQEIISQHSSLSTLNPTSVNTFRVITYLCDEDVKICPIALRIGRSSSDRDNIHNGGICVGVNNDGSLKSMAFSEYGERFIKHPDSNIIFDGYSIDISRILNVVKDMHSRVPYLGIISWDLCIDEENKPTLIEMNTTGQSAWFCQMVNGESLFGENTAKMLKLIKK